MTGAAKRKGDNAEREVAAILADQLGYRIRRKLGAGRTDDEGDIDGLPYCTVEVKSYADLARGIREGLVDLEREQANARTRFGALWCRRRGGG
jgi:Holliday junction resolvase